MHKSEWFATTLMMFLLLAACIGIVPVSHYIVEPYVASVYGVLGQDIASDNLWIAAICVVVVSAVLLTPRFRNRGRQVPVYLAGVSADNDARTFRDSLSNQTPATARNWYMEDVFGEKRIAPVGVVFNSAIMAVVFVLAFMATPMPF